MRDFQMRILNGSEKLQTSEAGRVRFSGPAPEDQQPGAEAHARPELGDGRAAAGDALRPGPHVAQAVQDLDAAARQKLHRLADPVARRGQVAPRRRWRHPATNTRGADVTGHSREGLFVLCETIGEDKLIQLSAFPRASMKLGC